MVERHCLGCGEWFQRPYRLGRPPVFCMVCADTRARDSSRRATRKFAAKAGSKTCKGCGEVFVPKAHPDARFCSQGCALRHSPQNKRRYPHKNGRAANAATCPGCGASFLQRRDSTGTFCSARCAQQDRREREIDGVDWAIVAERVRNGEPFNAIGRSLGCSAHIVRTQLANRGLIEPKPTNNRRRRYTGSRANFGGKVRGVCACPGCSRAAEERHHLNGIRSDARSENELALCVEHHMWLEWAIAKATPGILATEGTGAQLRLVG